MARKHGFFGAILLAGLITVTQPMAAQTQESTETLVATFGLSQGKGAQAQATSDLIASGASFESVLDLLRRSPNHDETPPVGEVKLETDIGLRDSTIFRALLLVPEDYTPDRTYPVRVYLHGGVQRPEWQSGESWWRRTDLIARDDAISIIPAAWSAHPWWRWSQVRHLQLLLDRVRREYNTDENQVSLIGVSDGGTGAYYLASHWATPWASVLPFISHPAVLANPGVAPDGATFPLALRNKPLLVVSGDDDRLYPSESVRPFMADFAQLGVSINYRGLPGVGHETSWWPKHATAIDAFIAEHPRTPHPDTVWWATDSPARYGRVHWMVIDNLGEGQNEGDFPQSSLMPPQGRHGRVHATRQGNRFTVETKGVSGLRILLSPDMIDFALPVVVTVNGTIVHNEVVSPSLATLLEWAGRDHDRTMLYGAELTVSVP